MAERAFSGTFASLVISQLSDIQGFTIAIDGQAELPSDGWITFVVGDRGSEGDEAAG